MASKDSNGAKKGKQVGTHKREAEVEGHTGTVKRGTAAKKGAPEVEGHVIARGATHARATTHARGTSHKH